MEKEEHVIAERLRILSVDPLAMLDGVLLGQLAAPEDDVGNAVLRPALTVWFERLPRGGA